MRARYDGICRICNERFYAGDDITWDRKQKGTISHVECFNRKYGRSTRPTPVGRPVPPVFTTDIEEIETDTTTTTVVDDNNSNNNNGNGITRDEIDAMIKAAIADAMRADTEIEENDATDIGPTHYLFDKLMYLVKKGHHCYLWSEQAGSGKSYAAQQVAVALNRHYGYISLNPQTPESRLIGYMDANGNYRETEFYKRYKDGGIFCIDEIDNASAQLLNTLNGLLEGNAGAFPVGIIKRHPNFVLVATGNTSGNGQSKKFPERRALDVAFRDRFTFIHWPIDKKLETKKALEINPHAMPYINWLHKVREYCDTAYPKLVVSPRATFKIVDYLKEDVFTIEEIAEMVIFKGMLDSVSIASIFNTCPLPR